MAKHRHTHGEHAKPDMSAVDGVECKGGHCGVNPKQLPFSAQHAVAPCHDPGAQRSV